MHSIHFTVELEKDGVSPSWTNFCHSEGRECLTSASVYTKLTHTVQYLCYFIYVLYIRTVECILSEISFCILLLSPFVFYYYHLTYIHSTRSVHRTCYEIEHIFTSENSSYSQNTLQWSEMYILFAAMWLVSWFLSSGSFVHIPVSYLFLCHTHTFSKCLDICTWCILFFLESPL